MPQTRTCRSSRRRHCRIALERGEDRRGHLRRCRRRSRRPRRGPAVRRPRSSTASTAASIRAAPRPPVEPVAEHHRHREEGRERVGDALAGDVGRRAVDGLEQARVRSAPRLAEGSIPSEPVSIADSSLRMSPNMFSVTITSKRGGSRDQLHRGVVDQQVVELDVGRSRRRRRSTISRQSREVSSTLALSTEVTRAPRPPARAGGLEGDAGDPLDLRRPSSRRCRGRGRRRGRCRRSRCRRSARGRRAGRCRRSAPGAAGWRRPAPGSAAPGAGWRRGRGPCAGRAGPARGAARRGRSCPTSGPPTAPSSTASAARQASSTSSVSAVPWASIEAPPIRCSSNSNSPSALEQPARGGDDLGADPVAREQDDARSRRHRGRPAAPTMLRRT